MKKLISTIMTLLLIFTITPTGFAAETKTDMMEGTTYLHLPNKSFSGPTVSSQLNIKNIELDQDYLQIEGNINYNQKNSPFRLMGNLKKSSLYNNGVTSVLVDQDNNFDVIYFSLADVETEQEKSALKNKNNGKLIQLYLLKKGTREFSMFEGQVDNFKRNKNLLNSVI